MIAKKTGERYRVVGADPYCESALFRFDSLCSGLKAIFFFRASGAKNSRSVSWWKHLNLQVTLLKTGAGNHYENFLRASGAIRSLRTHRISMST